MSPMLSFLCLLFQTYVISYEEMVTLHPDPAKSTIRLNNISLNIMPSNVNTTNQDWTLNPPSPAGYDIALQITNQWGFVSFTASTLSLTIDGFSPNEAKLSAEMLILFSTNNNKYFSIVVNLHDNIPWKTYPNDQGSELATNPDIFNNIINGNGNRWDRISNNNQWTNIGGSSSYAKGLKWPLKINITNDPIHHKVYYKCTEPDGIMEAIFDSSFDTNKGMDIYIMNNEAGNDKPFDIYSFNISYSYYTLSPSQTPTISPVSSSNPTTSNPTISPTLASNIVTSVSETGATIITEVISEQNGVIGGITSTDIVIYSVIGGVAVFCFIAGIMIGIIFYKRKIRKEIESQQSQRMGSELQETKIKVSMGETQDLMECENEKDIIKDMNEDKELVSLQDRLNKISSALDDYRAKSDNEQIGNENEDDEKLNVEKDVMITKIPTMDGIIGKTPTMDGQIHIADMDDKLQVSIHAQIMSTKRMSNNNIEGIEKIDGQSGDTLFVDR